MTAFRALLEPERRSFRVAPLPVWDGIEVPGLLRVGFTAPALQRHGRTENGITPVSLPRARTSHSRGIRLYRQDTSSGGEPEPLDSLVRRALPGVSLH